MLGIAQDAGRNPNVNPIQKIGGFSEQEQWTPENIMEVLPEGQVPFGAVIPFGQPERELGAQGIYEMMAQAAGMTGYGGAVPQPSSDVTAEPP